MKNNIITIGALALAIAGLTGCATSTQRAPDSRHAAGTTERTQWRLAAIEAYTDGPQGEKDAGIGLGPKYTKTITYATPAQPTTPPPAPKPAVALEKWNKFALPPGTQTQLPSYAIAQGTATVSTPNQEVWPVFAVPAGTTVPTNAVPQGAIDVNVTRQ